MFRTIATALAIGFAVIPATAAAPEGLKTVIADHWKWWLRTHPVSATALGVRDYDNQISDISLAAADKEAAEAKQFLTRLNAIPDARLSAADRVNKRILSRLLAEQIEQNGFGQRMIFFTSYASWHQSFADMASSLPFRVRGDYDSYLARLVQFPRLNAEIITVSRRAVKEGYVQPCAVLGGFEKTITGVIPTDPRASRFFDPFRELRPASVSEGDWRALQDRAAQIITTILAPEYKKFSDFFTAEYLPNCAKQVGVSAQPDGAAYYAFQARVHSTTTLTPAAIHQIGLDEVTRIRARMEALAKSSGFGTREEMIRKMQTDPRYFAKTPEDLLAAAATVAKQIDGKMPRYFKTLPRLPYGLKQIPAEIAEITTTAYYSPGAAASGIAGNYYLNTSKLPQRPFWELPALTAHEAVPGHHHQIALQQELPLPEFRRHLAGFTAFVEGWGLYAEYLGEEMGLYTSPEAMMGRLSFEMWRACRLVVDTGLHSKGWSKEQAIAFMRDNSALTDANIEAEVNRYISWPGQALGYKLGEIKIRELRARAETALSPHFDLAEFHDAVLIQGAVPLDVLDQQINDWIASKKRK